MTPTAIRHIAVVGATGKLAIPVVEAMVKEGYAVRALVRDEAKAKKVLPVSVEVVLADLRRPETVARALQGQDAVYINLSTLTERLDLPFYEEREGVSVVAEAAKENGLQHIYKIGAANDHPDRARPGTSLTTPESIRAAGNRYIEEGGIPYTIFDPTMFMENIEHQLTEDNTKWPLDRRSQAGTILLDRCRRLRATGDAGHRQRARRKPPLPDARARATDGAGGL